MAEKDCGGLDQFRIIEKVNTTPLLRDLYEHVTPRFAADWKLIGTLLGLPNGELKAIEAGYPTNVKWCCNQMLEKWLELDHTATWKKLFAAIEPPCDEGTDAVSVLFQIVRRHNIQSRFTTDEESWPPDQPKNFTPLVLVHHQGHGTTMEEPTATVESFQTSNVHSLSVYKDRSELLPDTSTVTKEIADILAPLEHSKYPQFILIEGAPGIGKSILLKEIAYRWGDGQLLKPFKLVLLICLRDPAIQQASLINDLIQLFCCRDEKTLEMAAACSNYFVKNAGKDLVFLFDGFDEFPDALWKTGLIADILKRKLLPQCGLIVSSRPHASVHLREQATIRVDILGFTNTERRQYIQQALDRQPERISELTQYLDQHFPINSLCYVPFNMVILLFLYKKGVPLPRNSTELYNYFVCLTICRYLARYEHTLENTITDLNSLPPFCKNILLQLSKLALEGLNHNRLVFTFEEINAACPDIAVTPGAINCFGLLQAVKHVGLTGMTTTFNFLHFSIQEFLAAHRVAHLPPHEELKFLQEKFWSKIHSNMFAIYVTLTKGQRSSFKAFLQPSLLKRLLQGREVSISSQFLDNQLQCLRLFQCFLDAGDNDTCRFLENAKIFDSKVINLENNSLTTSDVECLMIFLYSSSHKNWTEVYLWDCFIQDHGLQMLHLGVTNCDITIKALELNYNGLTKSSSAAIRDIVIHCEVEVLGISNNNTIGEDEKLYSILTSPSSMLIELYMDSINLSSSAAVKLFTALSESKKLKVLWIVNNNVDDEVCDAITQALMKNTSLCELRMESNPISGSSAQFIIQALRHNNTLQLLYLPYYPQDVEHKIRLSADVNKERHNRGCKVILNIHFKSFSRFRRSRSASFQ